MYATTEQLKQFMTGGTYGDDRVSLLLVDLESSSRRVDGYCSRGHGFGPVIATNSYRVSPRMARNQRLILEDDLVELIGVKVDGVDKDPDDFTIEPRALRGMFGWNSIVDVTGTWGFGYQVVPSGTALDDDLTEDAATIPVADSTKLVVGQIVLVDDEQMLVTALGDGTADVVRAQNGTTAATHSDEATVSVYRYLAEVVDATLRIAQRRWKSRDAGLTMDFGGGPVIPVTAHQDSEVSILRGTVGHLAYGLVG